MSPLNLVRRWVRLLAWAVSLGLAVTLAHALLFLEAAPLLEPLGEVGLALGTAALLTAVTFVVVWSAARLIELGPAWGAASGASGALLPLVVLVAVEGLAALGTARELALRSGSIALAAVAGALAARRRPPKQAQAAPIR